MSRNQLTPPHAQCNQREIRKPEFMTADLESGVLRFFRHIKCTMIDGAGILLLLILTSANPASANETTEYRLKTAFLYNFAVYTEWPENINGVFNLCFYGKHSFEAYLEHLEQKEINTLPIAVKNISNLNALKDCHMIYLSRSVFVDLTRIIALLDNKPILTVSDYPDGIENGIMLNMVVSEEGKIAFEVNLTEAKKSGLNFSSQLLRIARKVVLINYKNRLTIKTEKSRLS
ncbi:MAG: YfiR family protein [Nitrosomonas sp.]|nr:YfiR family protein [Nitrosomonas sp.]